MPGYQKPCKYCDELVPPDARVCPVCSKVNPLGPNRCPACRSPVRTGWQKCSHCGLSLRTPCPVCGEETFLGDYCQACGELLQTHCGNKKCGAVQPLGARACGECGRPLEPPPPPA